MQTTEMKSQLEQMIDSCSLSGLLELIANVCDEKAEHIMESYSDRNEAKKWNVGASLVSSITDKVKI